MKDDGIFNFFDTVSRVTFLIPVLLLIVMIVYVFGDTNKTVTSFGEKRLLISPTDSQQKLNLTGPFVCGITTKEATISASILNRNIAVQIAKNNAQNHYVVSGDCLYMWESKQLMGQKYCGISNYLVMAENLLSSSMFSIDTLMNIGSYSGASKINTTDIKKMVASCVKKEIYDLSVFQVPQSVKFTELKK